MKSNSESASIEENTKEQATKKLKSQQSRSNHAVEMITNDLGNGPERIEYIPSFANEPSKSHSQCAEECGTGTSSSSTEIDENEKIVKCLLDLAEEENSNLCQQLELLVKFDELQGWKKYGSKSCAAWISVYMRVDIRTAWERLRVGKCLRELPKLQSYFKSGQLSWSKLRLLTRIANPENEQLLGLASIDATVSDVQRICEEYRWPEINDEPDDTVKANKQWQRRRLNWRRLPDGNTQIKLILPPEFAQSFLLGIEQCEEILYQEHETTVGNSSSMAEIDDLSDESGVREDSLETDITPAQRRADAAVLMAERSVVFEGEHASVSDRFQVVVNIDNDSLSANDIENGENSPKLVRNPMIEGIGSIPINSARQIACDCSVVKMVTEEGEPTSIGRKQRVWPPAMRRAILTRDRHCQFPGCSSHRHLHIHHIHHWVDGGETSIENGVCLCQYHHRVIHSGKYVIERAASSSELPDECEMLEAKRKLLPMRSRFVVRRVDSEMESKFSYSSSKPSNYSESQFEQPTDWSSENSNQIREKPPRGEYVFRSYCCC